ncbi:hypothetical protein BFJ68_g5492 [Fusarium oxysporum]|uniref:Uncharacterized protein n=1 Tax=Fusarium oxysporum TaxID=5507 RepID=A0A420RFA4_FUSOX|nr:hypothetical protein BFJ68_g5492 [Fusarium oxysporum]
MAKPAVNRDAEASTVEGAAVSSEVDDEVRVSRRDLVSVAAPEAPDSVSVSVSVSVSDPDSVSVAVAPDSDSVSVASALSERVALTVVSVAAPETSVSEPVSAESVSIPLVWAVLDPISVMVETKSVSESPSDDVTVTTTLLAVTDKVVDSPASEFSDPLVDVSSAAVPVSVASAF